MTHDALLAAAWLALLGAGVGACIAARRGGVPATYVRDALHVGAGTWVFGWPSWDAPWWPVFITAGAFAVTASVPFLAPRSAAARAFRDAVTTPDERYGGIALYVAAFAAMTAAAFAARPFPAAAALLSLALGDGVGGAVGRRFGRIRWAAPGGKRKSVEGSMSVLAFAGAGAWAAAAWFAVPAPAAVVVAAAVAAAAAEAAAPAATDNIAVPAAVWAVLAFIA